jgi:hypothetical protein
MNSHFKSAGSKFVFLLGCAFTPIGAAQSNEIIRSGRPGQAIEAYVVGAGFFQIQSGADHAWSDGNSTSTSDLSSNVIRYGLNESFEISSVVNFQTDTVHSRATKSGFSDVQFGFRYSVNPKTDGWIPAVAVQTRLRTTTVSSDYRYDQIAPIMTVATNHNLAKWLALTTNWGMISDGNSSVPTYLFVGNFSFPVAGALGGFFELYTTSRDAVTSVYADTGFGYLVTSDLQIDLHGGFGNNHGTSESFLSAGLSYRTRLH